MQFAEMCLAHELVGDKSKGRMDDRELFRQTKKDTSVTCHIAISQLLVLKKEYERAKVHLLEVVKGENEVSNIYHFQISHNFKNCCITLCKMISECGIRPPFCSHVLLISIVTRKIQYY